MVPPISLPPKETSRELKEWGSDATEDEFFTLDTLDEFQCSDLRHIFRGVEMTPYAATSSSNVAAKRKGVETSLIEREVEEKRLKIGSLFRVIPQVNFHYAFHFIVLTRPYMQPHLYPTPSDPKKRTINGQYARCKPTYIAPYTPETYPKDTRVGWVIPLRGSVPWSDCTSGEVLDTVAMASPVQPGIKDQISWTQDAIVEFWYYLLQLRKGGSLGRLAVSFHASKGHKHVPEASNLAIGNSKVTGTSNVRHSPRNLSAVDFIKVYQDALDAPFVRNAIDVFRYQCAQENGITQQIRVLKGSRLALVDEFSQGILVL
ncbi:hypothetical protein CVT25_010390 [Psilocybe cyanescens]|uniref:Uncharacterized protein n=1 Tax=Psilocybe cyanescens TaxID=93625 RepID=A0A409XPA1_PSICY|nr:hypothetical protein CVT25_010390 [Psilocybe cyanescens]